MKEEEKKSTYVGVSISLITATDQNEYSTAKRSQRCLGHRRCSAGLISVHASYTGTNTNVYRRNCKIQF